MYTRNSYQNENLALDDNMCLIDCHVNSRNQGPKGRWENIEYFEERRSQSTESKRPNGEH